MIHPLAVHFENVVDEYEDGRPEFPAAVAGAIGAELGLEPGARVLDLAAGTGKLARRLLAAGFDVVAVEPGASLRKRLAAAIGAERVREGFAEAIPLEDGSVDAVTVADAFHWFDQEAALAEIRRVLRPPAGAGAEDGGGSGGAGGGGLAIVFVGQDWRGAEWGEELAGLVAELRPEHPLFDGPSWQQVVRDSPGWDGLREIAVTVPWAASREQILSYLTSFSFVAMLGEAERAAAIDRAAAILGDREVPGELPVRFQIALTRPA